MAVGCLPFSLSLGRGQGGPAEGRAAQAETLAAASSRAGLYESIYRAWLIDAFLSPREAHYIPWGWARVPPWPVNIFVHPAKRKGVSDRPAWPG